MPPVRVPEADVPATGTLTLGGGGGETFLFAEGSQEFELRGNLEYRREGIWRRREGA